VVVVRGEHPALSLSAACARVAPPMHGVARRKGGGARTRACHPPTGRQAPALGPGHAHWRVDGGCYPPCAGECATTKKTHPWPARGGPAAGPPRPAWRRQAGPTGGRGQASPRTRPGPPPGRRRGGRGGRRPGVFCLGRKKKKKNVERSIWKNERAAGGRGRRQRVHASPFVRAVQAGLTWAGAGMRAAVVCMVCACVFSFFFFCVRRRRRS
jgi:hypothetical protein